MLPAGDDELCTAEMAVTRVGSADGHSRRRTRSAMLITTVVRLTPNASIARMMLLAGRADSEPFDE
jgi:hypothetical protein